ncbi:MAG: hypothetical protein A2W91_08465 [Bacteroidetes bacterium GWF2_38_335]|nr:MAG: hypothetical protein A2W91_08465 [Bacteroidetes bacterium GWF2_38_335]OFY78926.1 MAG: hypothetical protein A2281_02255 [Bacteroidetes bacterium RIFOXYA12_FULL_38_20]
MFVPGFLSGQQLPQFSQRMIDESVFNPAVIGTRDFSSVKLHHRSQWLGFDNAPSTQTFSYDGIINEKMGAGGYVLNDITGPTRRLGFNLAYSYHVKISDYFLSFGLSATFLQFGIDGTKIDLHQSDDPIVTEDISDKAWKPDAAFGTYFYNDKFYVGFSVQQLFQSKFRLDGLDGINASMPLTRHYFITSGYKMELNENIMLDPSFQFNGTIGSPAQFDLNVKAYYKNKIMGGLSFRVNDALVMLLGIKIQDIFTIAYSYDLTVSKFRKYNSGSHEILIAFHIKKKSSAASIVQ